MLTPSRLQSPRLPPLLQLLTVVACHACAALGLGLPAPFPPSNGGWFEQERKVPPAGGTPAASEEAAEVAKAGAAREAVALPGASSTTAVGLD